MFCSITYKYWCLTFRKGVDRRFRGVKGQKTPEMNVSRTVDTRSAHVFYFTPSEPRERAFFFFKFEQNVASFFLQIYNTR